MSKYINHVYRVFLDGSQRMTGGDLNNCNFIINIPKAKINKGYVYIESLSIDSNVDGTLFAGKRDIQISSTLFRNPNSVRSTGSGTCGSWNSITSIPLKDEYFIKTDSSGTSVDPYDFRYKTVISSEEVALGLLNFDLSNMNLDIQLRDQAGTLLTNSKITSWCCTLCFVDSEPQREKFVGINDLIQI